MSIQFDSPDKRYPTVFVVLAFVSQVVSLQGMYLLTYGYDPSILYASGFYFIVLTWLWLHLSYPERKIHPWIFNICFIPYFFWQFFSFLMFIPYLAFFLLYGVFFFLLPSYMTILHIVFGIISFLMLLVVCHSFFYGSKQLHLKEIALKHPEKDITDYKIVHLSDLHVGNFITPRYLRKISKCVNDSEPDIIVITGDLLTFGDHFMEDAVDFVSHLKAKDGVFFSLGNHEYYIDTVKLINKLKDIGCIVLCTDVHKNNILTLGAISGVINDLEKSQKELREIIAKNGNETPDILLAHDPLIFNLSHKNHIPLTLSGHTHGGQIKFPFYNLGAVGFNKLSYISGLYRIEKSYLYVHNGLGTSGLPFRIGVNPEIVLFTLN